ncbi:MAG: pantetheine-phosphate adenylyltransferase [Candidatus Hydrogenedentota bacterium]|nr:MAG: pantetheine-phosphate adenylyltransferase [Candidatus Hydrogenedentota bacterium]
MRKAVYPGSFDPFTNGHLDIVKRSLKIVDSVTIAVLKNTSKKNLFTPDERVEMIRETVKDLGNVEVETFSGLLVDFCKHHNISIVIRGLRAVSDFDYEHAIFLMNRQLLEGLETVFLLSSENHSFISSSIVKEVASLGGDISGQVPPPILARLHKHFQ